MVSKPQSKATSQLHHFRKKPLVACVQAMITGGVFMGGISPLSAHPALPIEALTGWTNNAGVANETTVGNTMTITQHVNAATYNWQSFDVGQNAQVIFVEPNANSVAINYIGSGSESQIQGLIKSNGEVLLINQNGFVFENGAVVDTSGMVASTLMPTQEVLNSLSNPGASTNVLTGLANPNTTTSAVYASFTADGTSNTGGAYTGATPNPNAEINIKQGASLISENGKPIIILAPTITNDGQVSSSGGQVIMAAAKDVVYLQEAPTDGVSSQSDVRGLLVEVGTGGNVSNSIHGAISANQGNVTLIGFAVNQQGRISSTTSINENGTIRLLATQGLGSTTIGVNDYLQINATSTGTVTLGKQSVTDILPEVQYVNGVETTAVQAQAITPSRLEIVGGTVQMQSDATSSAQINVPAGIVKVLATQDPSNPMQANVNNGSSLEIDSGVGINVAGLDSTASMSSNVISVKLQSNELADSALQKSGFLFGQTVQIDIRADNGAGTPLANIATEKAALPYTLEQSLGKGGTIDLQSEGSIDVQSKSVMNISGGETSYSGGYVDTTKLITSTGQIVDIGNASPLATYVGIYGQVSIADPKWGVTQTWTLNNGQQKGQYESGYVQGYDAGKFNISANTVIMDGTLQAQASNGQYQRTIAEQAQGGVLTISNTLSTAIQDIVFANSATQNTGVTNLDQSGNALVLDSYMLGRSGLSSASFNTNGAIRISNGADLQLAANSTLKLTADLIDVSGSSIQGAGATVSMSTQQSGVDSRYDGTVTLKDANINLQGGWVNDYANSANLNNGAAINIKGGTVAVSAQGNVDADGAVINVNGGAWLQANRSLTDGSAGSISLKAVNDTNVSLSGATFSAYGLATGGSLALEAGQVLIGGAGPATALVLSDNFFSSDGFSSYTITADANGLTVADGATINLSQTNSQLNGEYMLVNNAQNISAISHITTLPDNLIAPSTLNLVSNHTANQNSTSELTVGKGSRIIASNQSTINMSSDTSINFDGGIVDHGGSVAMNITAAGVLAGEYVANQSIWLNSDANIDVSGALVATTNNLGLVVGTVLDGGNVSLTANQGFVATQTDSNINVSGSQANISLPVEEAGNRVAYHTGTVGSNGGNIDITAAEGVYLQGNLQAHAGDAANVLGGSLTVSLKGGLSSSSPLPVIDVVQDTASSNILVGGAYVSADVLTQANQFNQPGDAQPLSLNALGIVGAKQVADAGFASLALQVEASTRQNGSSLGEILFQGNTNVNHGNIDLHLADALTLDAPIIAWALSDNTNPAHGVDVTNQIAGNANLSAASITVGSSVMNSELIAGLPAATGGMGQFNLTAGVINTQGVQQDGLITLQGEATTSGFAAVNMQASQDVMLEGLLNQTYNVSSTTDSYQGGFQTYAQLNITADRIYPSTLSQFTLATSETNGVISFYANNHFAPKAVLEADANLTVQAGTINQNGNLLDPFGKINLDAANQINFAADSLTSVSGQNQIIPFGITSAGQTWLYPLNDYAGGVQMSLTVGGTSSLGSIPVPEKQLNLTAPVVTAKTGAVIDLSGGGDLLASEFVPGDGGSKNVLLAGNAVGGGTSYAIIPGYTGYAPYDPYLSSSSTLQVGEQVTIGSGSALPAGTYTLLPAQYAVLPGAYVITPQAVTEPQGWSSERIDGAALVSGQYGIAGTGLHYSLTSSGTETQGWSEFIVQTAGEVLRYSQINLTYGDSFFASQATANGLSIPQLAEDAGQFSANVTTALDLPTLLTSGNVGAKVDISANNLSVVKANLDTVAVTAAQGVTTLQMQNVNGWQVGDIITGENIAANTVITGISGNLVTISAATTGAIDKGASLDAYQLDSGGNEVTNATGIVVLLDTEINNNQIGSLFLGGTRSIDNANGNTVLNVNANDVTVSSGVTLNKTSEILLAAGNIVEVGSNATVQTVGSSATAANTVLETTGDSAVLRVANGDQVTLDRTGSSGVTGSLLIDQGAILKAGNDTVSGSIMLDTTGNSNNLQGSFSLDSKGSLAIAANELNLIDNNTNQALLNGMSIDSTQLANLGGIANLNLTGHNYIDIYGAIDTPQITNLVLNTPVLAGMTDSSGSANNAQINATNLTLANYAGSGCAAASGCSGNEGGNLTVDAAKLTLDSTGAATSQGSFAISGYDNVTMNVTNQVLGNGHGAYDIQGNATINTPLITGNTAANTTIDASGNLTVDHLAGSAASNSIGAVLNLTAANLQVDTSLIYLGGNVNLDSSASNLQLGDNSVINVSASQQAAGLNSAVQIAGGEITLTSAEDVDTSTGSQLLLSSSLSGVAAGTLTVNAGKGNANLNGQIVAGGPDKADGGKLILDVNSLGSTGFDGYNHIVNSDGFSGGFNLRLRNGDIVVDQLVTAQNINFDADNGSITIGSSNVSATLDATGVNGGSISLSSDSLIQIDSNSHLNAYALGNTGNGGKVTLSAVSQVVADNTNQSLAAGSIVMQSNSSIDVRGKGDYSLINCQTLGECGSMGSVQFLVDRQTNAAGVGNVNNVTLDGAINITPYNSGSASLGYDATQAMPEIIAVKVYDLSNSSGSDVANQITANDLSNSSGLPNFSGDAKTFMANLPVSSSYVVVPGIEAITTGGADMLVNPGAAWNLSTWRYSYGAETVPGLLILRSSGSLDVQQNITDGFTTLTGSDTKTNITIPVLQSGYSWSYELVAGADLSAADSHAVTVDPAANLNLSPATVIRTGAGNIDVNVAGDINMSNNSMIYSAGRQVASDPWGYNQTQVFYDYAFDNQYYAEYPVNGGSVSVAAGGNINVSLTGSTTKMGFYTDWLLRSGGVVNGQTVPTSWGINFAKYNDNLGALGGGNVTVVAGGNISNLTVAIPTTAKINPNDYAGNTTAKSPSYTGNYPDPTVSGGGNLYLTAGGNIAGGAFYVQQGVADISAAGSLTAGSYQGATSNYLDPILALGDAQMTVTAGNNIALETIVNPTIVASAQKYGKLNDSLFFTYGSNSSVTLTALSGDVTLDNNTNDLHAGTDIAAAVSANESELQTYAGSLTVNALQGSLNLLNGMQLFPSATGNLDLYAYNNIDSSAAANNSVTVLLPALDPSSLPSASAPASLAFGQDLNGYKSGAVEGEIAGTGSITDYSQTPLHLNDPNPVLISTATGNIESLSSNGLVFALSKQALVNAGDSILNTGFMIQNDTAASNSLISANRNIEFSTPRDPATGALATSANGQIIQVSGPGQLTVLSGGNINLGSSSGIISVGNTGVNTYLPNGGANLTVMAGLGNGVINATGFAQNFMTDSSQSATFNTLFSNAMQNYLIQNGSVPTSQSLQTFVSQAQSAAVSQLANQGQAINFGYKEYFTQYMLDYWNHYSGNLAVDGAMSLITQEENAALASQTANSPQYAVAYEFNVLFSQYMQTALSNSNGGLTLSGFENLMTQAETNVLTTLTPQSAMTSLASEGYTSAEYLSWIDNYKTTLNQNILSPFATYETSQPIALAVAGVLNQQAATAAQASFDGLQQAYNAELVALVQGYVPDATVNSANALTYLNQLTSSQQALVEKQLLPFVQTAYGMDQKQFAEQRAAATLTVGKDSLELDIMATTESLFPGTTLLSLNPVLTNTPLTSDYHYDQTAGWVANSNSLNVDTIINNTDVVQLQAIAALYGNAINLGNGTTVDISAAIQTISTEANSAYSKLLLSDIYAARPDIQAAVRPVEGNLSLFFSTIQTTGGGNINLLAPNGGIDAGLSASTIGQKSADQLGIIVRGQGDINALLRDDFQVNLTRVMTLGGGDVVAGSTEGSIDAGKGVALNGAVQQQVSYDIYGNPVVTLLPPVTTSGIRSASPANSDIKSGTIVLFAPRGTIDAGEAGIAGGNLFLDASAFKNTANITSSTGVSVGAPPSAPPAGVSASLSGASGLTATVNKSFESSTDVGKDTSEERMKASTTLGVLTIDLLGFGD